LNSGNDKGGSGRNLMGVGVGEGKAVGVIVGVDVITGPIISVGISVEAVVGVTFICIGILQPTNRITSPKMNVIRILLFIDSPVLFLFLPQTTRD
jgi:hypothetical protein